MLFSEKSCNSRKFCNDCVETRPVRLRDLVIFFLGHHILQQICLKTSHYLNHREASSLKHSLAWPDSSTISERFLSPISTQWAPEKGQCYVGKCSKLRASHCASSWQGIQDKRTSSEVEVTGRRKEKRFGYESLEVLRLNAAWGHSSVRGRPFCLIQEKWKLSTYLYVKYIKQKIIRNKMHYPLLHERHRMNDSHLSFK